MIILKNFEKPQKGIFFLSTHGFLGDKAIFTGSKKNHDENPQLSHEWL
jgi:hypothetical protein